MAAVPGEAAALQQQVGGLARRLGRAAQAAQAAPFPQAAGETVAAAAQAAYGFLGQTRNADDMQAAALAAEGVIDGLYAKLTDARENGADRTPILLPLHVAKACAATCMSNAPEAAEKAADALVHARMTASSDSEIYSDEYAKLTRLMARTAGF